MSIKRPGNLNSTRMVSSTFDSINSITERFEKQASNEHASIILRDAFWRRLQEQLTNTISTKRQMLAAGGYTDAARKLRTVETLSIRTAIEEFRGDTLDVPDRIHDDDAWDQFRARIREHTNECTF